MKAYEIRSVVMVIVALSHVLPVRAQKPDDIRRLRPLVESSAQRLLLADQVALAKWDTSTAVEDARREADVIASAVRLGESKSLGAAPVTDFFRGQIEANKLVQYSLLAKWRRAGGAPSHAPVDLVVAVRPELDRIQIELVTALANTREIRSRSNCRDDIAQAVGEYLIEHKPMLDTLHAVALDRALAMTCSP